MPDVLCPVCASPHHQSFWYWEKEDQLIRKWAMDTTVHFSICRICATIFQNPLVQSPSPDNAFLQGWDIDNTNIPPVQEPMEWLKQFTGFGKEPGRLLEVYTTKKRFEEPLGQKGWTVKSIPVSLFDGSLGDSQTDIDRSGLEENERFDLIVCFEALGQTARPLNLLSQLHKRLKDDGALYVEVTNPMTVPRVNKISLTSEEAVIYPYQSLIFTLYKAGFTNKAAELCGKIRCICTKIGQNLDTEVKSMVPRDHWSKVLSAVQRNYNWTWATNFLKKYQAEMVVRQHSGENFLQETRISLRKRPLDLHIIRDVCGASLLFTQEVATLRETLSQDWTVTMGRIFDILKSDYALYELFQVPVMPDFGLIPDIERYYLYDKMVFMTNPDYFERFFTQQEAEKLCDSIIRAGEVVCKTLSSFL